jgi:hypothetical protein
LQVLAHTKSEEVQATALVYASDLFPFASDQELFLDTLFKLGPVAAHDLKRIVQEATQFVY